MSRKKLQRFAETEKFPNLAQVHQPDIKEKLADFLEDNNSIILELACGKGAYTLALAKKLPHIKFIGIDIQGERLWSGAKQAIEQNLKNVFFLRIQIENLAEYFTKNSINEILITFPDPFPREKQLRKRLTSYRFLEIYKQLIKEDGLIHLKTDDENLFDFSVETIQNFGGTIKTNTKDIYSKINIDPILEIKTYYEHMHLKAGKKINYLKFSL
ncbi:tRNA (guanosine(46)-N7)-methyltransferase TrmB [Candidatus Parcubacteria bacterium]|jgi:tRNA (guanine-N7-)-methyltransferase|nr:tRNA (guanosine(46)-N7)-methyltransferase TrmB [Candidatus Parcubacteria bacterium]MBT7228599.1 tRNA (guanosine(46)-N7)-methyltransferase TrmB [Candidatus Parcubacteria bacterium]